MKVTINHDSHAKLIEEAVKLAEEFRTVSWGSDRSTQILARYQQIEDQIGYDPVS